MQEISTSTIETSQQLNIFDLVLHSGPISLSVLLILLAFSLVSWAVVLTKWTTLRKAEAHSLAFLDIFRKSKRFSEVHAVCHELRVSPLVGLFLAGYNEINLQLKSNDDSETNVRVTNLESIARALARASSAETLKLESRLTFLATTGSATPFIGLFGTVWGIMNAFQQIGAVQSANISVVAPGVSEALIATAAGLAAAIPAVIFYNLFTNWVKRISTQMDDFTLEYISIIERNFT